MPEFKIKEMIKPLLWGAICGAILTIPKLSDSDDIESRGVWIPAFAGMTNKTQRVPVMPVPDLARDDGSGIQSMVMPVSSGKSLNLGFN